MHVKSLVAILAAGAALAASGCGSSASSRPSTTQAVSAASGGTLTAGAATLSISPGALASDTTVTLREAEPHHSGRATRIEVEPHAVLVAGHEAHVAVRVSASNPRVAMHQGSDDSLASIEVEDRNHHEFKTNMSTLGDVEVEVEAGAACTLPCGPGQECDDGVCKDHDDSARICSTVCDTGQECDDGTCKTHDQFELDHHGTPGTCSPSCPTGLTCHDGFCSNHG